MKTVEERLKEYEPLWENWTYTGNFLGEGAMSSVFEIESTAMGLREVAALKIITVKKDINGEVKIPKTALNEIKILRALSGCPNIINYHDSTQRKIYDEDKNLESIDLLIKMEELRSLSERDKLSEKEVVKLAKDICKALCYASKHGVIHRDIKPQNIFVDDDGVYKLGDFGIAKIVSEFSHHYTMNIGTMAYTAPEICNGKSTTYDIASDIYSLGLVLYVFLNNGYLPFVNSATSVNDAIAKRFSGAEFPSPLNGSKALKRIVMRACCEDVTRRYKKPEEMLEDLETLSSGGKKMVVDPFATLDANIDIAEYLKTSYSATEAVKPMDVGDSATKSTDLLSDGKKRRGLKINMGKKPDGKKPDSDKTIIKADTSYEKPSVPVSPTPVSPISGASEPVISTHTVLKPITSAPVTPAPVVLSPVVPVVAEKSAAEPETDSGATVYMPHKASDESDVVFVEKVKESDSTVYIPADNSESAPSAPVVEKVIEPIPMSGDSSRPVSAGSGLRIRMGSKSPDSKVEVKKEKDEEASKFFITPPSL